MFTYIAKTVDKSLNYLLNIIDKCQHVSVLSAIHCTKDVQIHFQ